MYFFEKKTTFGNLILALMCWSERFGDSN